eukprot:COSAG06_NODE_3229_length_5647_cov_3.480534_3_plen_52_part_00
MSDDAATDFRHLLSTPGPENEAGLGPEFSDLGAFFRPGIAPRSLKIGLPGR